MENNFSAHLLSDPEFKLLPGDVRVPIHLTWYRSLPLSVVEVASLKLDGNVVAPEHIQFEINGNRHALSALPELVDEWWYVLDSAILHVHGVALKDRGDHTVDLTLNLHPPYIPGMTWVTQSTRTYRSS